MQTMVNADATLAAVRELSERWQHRPAPLQLRCIPMRTRELKRVPSWQFQRAYLLTHQSAALT